MKFKGYDFAQRRLTCHLSKYYREHGANGYILLFDFSKFYDNVDHALLLQALRKQLADQRIMRMVRQIIGTFGSTVGLGLGSQISQILALLSANELDHAIKQDMRIRYYARYNDDGYLIHHSKEYLQQCLKQIRELCAKLHIKLNEKKTQIVKLSHGFKFLKARVYLTETGRIVKKPPKERITIQRRKMKKLKKKLLNGQIDMPHIAIQYQSWRSTVKKYFRAWHTIRNMDSLYKALYKEAAT